ncbi:GbsR/MarR family transcriptional regulator [Solicola gregarius]|uniref:MarR family transcriptional regulator n=1 Tax=Solicola gregarius TaxID=2908642 RepID=A0AA46TL63_9ACTN|nr:MarR family transcriptional regulator [Solicola gregarius]UYM07311.1 MarR family transcriptional regulator [Solicola gregarius]
MADDAPPATALTDDERATLLEVVEHLAMVMTESGLPRMPARVFAYVLADDAEIYTAGELSEGLRVSPAAISGAVRYLVNVGLLAKQRLPGDRRDHYRVFDEDVFGAMIAQRAPVLGRWSDAFGRAVEVLGADRPGGRRLADGVLFFEFMQEDQQDVLARWHAYRAAHGGQRTVGDR